MSMSRREMRGFLREYNRSPHQKHYQNTSRSKTKPKVRKSEPEATLEQIDLKSDENRKHERLNDRLSMGYQDLKQYMKRPNSQRQNSHETNSPRKVRI